jgi:hypothetical protein
LAADQTAANKLPEYALSGTKRRSHCRMMTYE